MQPCLVPAGSPIGQLEGVTNMVVIEGDFVGRIVMSGPGAGEGPTASAIVGDVIDVARGLVDPAFGRPAARLAAAGARPATARRRPTTCASWSPTRRACWRRWRRRSATPGISINRMRQVEHATRRGADPDRHPPRRAAGARPRARRDRRGSTSAGRRRWRSASRRSDACEVRPARRRGHARRSRRSMPTTCCTASRPSRRCRPTPPRWRGGARTCWRAGCPTSSPRRAGACSATPTPGRTGAQRLPLRGRGLDLPRPRRHPAAASARALLERLIADSAAAGRGRCWR